MGNPTKPHLCPCPNDCGKTVSCSYKGAGMKLKMDTECAKSYHGLNPDDQTIVNPKTNERVDCRPFFNGGNLRALFRIRQDMVKYRQDDGVVAGSKWISGEQVVAQGVIPEHLPCPLSIHPSAFDSLVSSKKVAKKAKKKKKEKRSIDHEFNQLCRDSSNNQQRNRRAALKDVPSFNASASNDDVVEAMYDALYKAVIENPELFIGAYWFTCQRGRDMWGNILPQWQEEKRFMKASGNLGSAPWLDKITRNPFKISDMSEPGVLRGSKPVVISCVGLWPCVTASEAQHYEKVGVQMNESLEEANPGSILNLNQDPGGTGSCHDEAPAFGLCIVHNPAEILRKYGGFNTACSIENCLCWKKTCEEYEEGLYCEVHPKNESKPSSSRKKKHSSGQRTLLGVKLQDTKYYSAKTYSSAGVKRSKSPKEVSASKTKKRKAVFDESNDDGK